MVKYAIKRIILLIPTLAVVLTLVFCLMRLVPGSPVYAMIEGEDYSPEEILNLPEQIAAKMDIHIVVCIDEFQQIGEWADSLTIQKRMRSVWQHQQHTSYCLFGSKKHLLANLFQNRRMPFYHFGDTIFLKPISTNDWIPFICGKFAEKGKKISEELVGKICTTVASHSQPHLK